MQLGELDVVRERRREGRIEPTGAHGANRRRACRDGSTNPVVGRPLVPHRREELREQDVTRAHSGHRLDVRCEGTQPPGLTPEALESLVVGRRRNGLPIAAGTDADPKDDLAVNGFTFKDDAMAHTCPLSAHIRKVKPRHDSTARSRR